MPGFGRRAWTPWPNPGQPIPQEPATPLNEIDSYNNDYEFGTDKSDPADKACGLKAARWSVVIDGECAKPGTIALEDLIKPGMLEERIYRHRCVEGWSTVIPWVGIPLATALRLVEPTSQAKYVAFETLVRPSEMPGQRSAVLGACVQIQHAMLG